MGSAGWYWIPPSPSMVIAPVTLSTCIENVLGGQIPPPAYGTASQSTLRMLEDGPATEILPLALGSRSVQTLTEGAAARSWNTEGVGVGLPKPNMSRPLDATTIVEYEVP